MKNKDVWQFIEKCLHRKIAVMLVAVVESHGASPGKAGFKMAVAENGERRGTIGGGVMEMNWIEKSLSRLGERNPVPFVQTLFHSRGTTHEPSGLICSGSQTLLLCPFDSHSTGMVREIIRTYEQKQCGRLRIEMNGVSFEPNQRYTNDFSFSFKSQNDWLYQENLGILDTVLIIGSGHVGLALSRIMSTLDFRVVVIDDRADVPTFADNSFAHQKIHSRYDEIEEYLSGSGGEYVAVVTTGYKSDEAALKVIIDKNVKYIGLMGSAAKTKQIFDDLRHDGITDEQLKRIHTPIGLSIASHTPEEIAVSIAAEIIKVRNEST